MAEPTRSSAVDARMGLFFTRIFGSRQTDRTSANEAGRMSGPMQRAERKGKRWVDLLDLQRGLGYRSEASKPSKE